MWLGTPWSLVVASDRRVQDNLRGLQFARVHKPANGRIEISRLSVHLRHAHALRGRSRMDEFVPSRVQRIDSLDEIRVDIIGQNLQESADRAPSALAVRCNDSPADENALKSSPTH